MGQVQGQLCMSKVFPVEGVLGRWALKWAEVIVVAEEMSRKLSVNVVRAELRARLSMPVSINDALGS